MSCGRGARRLRGGDLKIPDQPFEDWPVTAPAVPHDDQTANEGNTCCPGVPGNVPDKPLSDLRAASRWLRPVRKRHGDRWTTTSVRQRG